MARPNSPENSKLFEPLAYRQKFERTQGEKLKIRACSEWLQDLGSLSGNPRLEVSLLVLEPVRDPVPPAFIKIWADFSTRAWASFGPRIRPRLRPLTALHLQMVIIDVVNLWANMRKLSAKNSSLIITSYCKSLLWINFSNIWIFKCVFIHCMYHLLNVNNWCKYWIRIHFQQ